MKILVGMSGGVDSAAVALLLKEQGHEVIGITYQLYDSSAGSSAGSSSGSSDNFSGKSCASKTCCAISDIHDAKAVCNQLNIPHYVLNREEIFKREIIDSFVEDYIAGITPIPCTKCNSEVKIKDLVQFAKKIGADKIATGHYARIFENENGDGNELHLPVYLPKDQTYFLYNITQEEIDYLLFPLGDKTKQEVRQYVKDNNLFIADKKESQNICFVPDGNHVDVIKSLRPDRVENIDKGGDIVVISTGEKVGLHDGLMKYTIGQRKGLGVAYSKPLYVVKKDYVGNVLYVDEESHLYGSKLVISDCNFFQNQSFPMNVKVCLRALKKHIPAKINKIDNSDKLFVELLHPERAITTGQVCAIYDDTKLIGGGIIKSVIEDS